jgi:hypothetical protein
LSQAKLKGRNCPHLSWRALEERAVPAALNPLAAIAGEWIVQNKKK